MVLNLGGKMPLRITYQITLHIRGFFFFFITIPNSSEITVRKLEQNNFIVGSYQQHEELF